MNIKLNIPMHNAIFDAIIHHRPFFWINTRKPHGIFVMKDWSPLND